MKYAITVLSNHHSPFSTISHAHLLAQSSFPDAQSPIFCAATGHYYKVVSSSTGTYSFEAAVNLAGSTWNNFNPGYLATITTTAERDCVKTMMYPGNQWIGGIDYYSEGTFRWVDGPEAGSPITGFWGDGEPNGGRSENCIVLISTGVFVDYFCSYLSPAFLIEFNNDAPEACTLNGMTVVWIHILSIPFSILFG
jgi:hypothetical protein